MLFLAGVVILLVSSVLSPFHTSSQELYAGRRNRSHLLICATNGRSAPSPWILFVDDEASIREAVGSLLKDNGYTVSACANGKEALQKTMASSTLPDLILSDVRMPGQMDGLELLRNLRHDPKTVSIPIILLTAKSQTMNRIEAYEGGVDAYIVKPFDPDELLTVINGVLSKKERLRPAKVEVKDLERDLKDIRNFLRTGSDWVKDAPVFLTEDERKILEKLCHGMRTKDIAAETFLSTRRIEQLLTSMFKKARVKNRTELVRWAIANGHVTL